MTTQILEGDCRDTLKTIPEKSVHCCVTSPPYFGLRDYGNDSQIGLEQTPEAFVQELVSVFREVKRVLRDDGTLWLNIGDSYARQAGDDSKKDPAKINTGQKSVLIAGGIKQGNNRPPSGLKPKDLIGIPWRVAFALQADGWYLRQDIIWHKPNPMPESVTDRCTKAHEYVFLLSKKSEYYYDNESIKEITDNKYTLDCIKKAAGLKERPSTNPFSKEERYSKKQKGLTRAELGALMSPKRNKRSVWSVNTKPYRGAHFATYPPELIEPCIIAGCPKGGTVLDPFGGSGTTAQVAMENNRSAILCELNPEYVKLINHRLAQIQPTLL